MPRKHITNYLKATGKHLEDVFLCEWCGSPIRVSFHHLKFKSSQGSDEFPNIMALCGSLGNHKGCHDKAHFKKRPYLFYEELKEKHMKLVNNI